MGLKGIEDTRACNVGRCQCKRSLPQVVVAACLLSGAQLTLKFPLYELCAVRGAFELVGTSDLDLYKPRSEIVDDNAIGGDANVFSGKSTAYMTRYARFTPWYEVVRERVARHGICLCRDILGPTRRLDMIGR